MKFYVLASLIIFVLVIFHNVRKSGRQQEAQEKIFWERERMANNVRRKSLDGLEYIKIPLEILPLHILAQEESVADCLRMINELSMQPIVNLTGKSNTDLKLEYGTANITALMEYDQNYTLLASTLQQWASLLYNAGYIEETRQILEFAVSTRTDVSGSYDILSDIYVTNKDFQKIHALMQTAETLESLNKDVILRHLQEKIDHS